MKKLLSNNSSHSKKRLFKPKSCHYLDPHINKKDQFHENLDDNSTKQNLNPTMENNSIDYIFQSIVTAINNFNESIEQFPNIKQLTLYFLFGDIDNIKSYVIVKSNPYVYIDKNQFFSSKVPVINHILFTHHHSFILKKIKDLNMQMLYANDTRLKDLILYIKSNLIRDCCYDKTHVTTESDERYDLITLLKRDNFISCITNLQTLLAILGLDNIGSFENIIEVVNFFTPNNKIIYNNHKTWKCLVFTKDALQNVTKIISNEVLLINDQDNSLFRKILIIMKNSEVYEHFISIQGPFIYFKGLNLTTDNSTTSINNQESALMSSLNDLLKDIEEVQSNNANSESFNQILPQSFSYSRSSSLYSDKD